MAHQLPLNAITRDLTVLNTLTVNTANVTNLNATTLKANNLPVMQWGSATGNGGNLTVIFPQPFASIPKVFLTYYLPGLPGGTYIFSDIINLLSATGFSAVINQQSSGTGPVPYTGNVFWLAIS